MSTVIASPVSNPPKFQTTTGQVGPVGVQDWTDFYRWLTSQFKTINSAINLIQTLTQQVTPGWIVEPIVNNEITPDCAAGLVHVVILDQPTQITVNDAVNPSSALLGSIFSLYVVQDVSGQRPTPRLGTGYVGVDPSWTMAIDPNTYSALNFRVSSNGKLYLMADPINGAAWVN